MSRYAEFYRRSIDAPEAFWAEQAKLIDWKTPPQQILDASHAAVRALVRGRHHQPVPQRGRPPPGRRAATSRR